MVEGGSSLVTAPGEQGGFWEKGRPPEVVRSISELTTHEAGRMLWGSPAFSHQSPSMGGTSFLALWSVRPSIEGGCIQRLGHILSLNPYRPAQRGLQGLLG